MVVVVVIVVMIVVMVAHTHDHVFILDTRTSLMARIDWDLPILSILYAGRGRVRLIVSH
jgi:hypothetical protein